jgi:threonine aldolase
MTAPIIDLRSDTVTKPTLAMYAAMLEAPVGDDVYGEDPSINALQVQAAKLLGFEAGMFMPSGTMTNQVAIAVHTQRGQEVICTEGAHIYEYELGMMAAFSGVVPRFVHAPLGIPDPEAVRKAVRHSIHQSPTGLIALENTHNVAGGTVLPVEVLAAIEKLPTAKTCHCTSTALEFSTPPPPKTFTSKRLPNTFTASRSASQKAWAHPSARCCSDQKTSLVAPTVTAK